MSDSEKIELDHNYSHNLIKNINFDHNYDSKSQKKASNQNENDFLFYNLDNFPEYDTSIIKKRYVQSWALAGACCDITYDIQDEVINQMQDYYQDVKLLHQIYIQEFTTQLSHASIFKVNPHIHVFFTNSLYDPEKGMYDPDTQTYNSDTTNRDVQVERHIWLKAFQIEPSTDLNVIVQDMLSEFVKRIESTEAGPSGLIYQCFTSTTLAYSLNCFEYGGCDLYETLPQCITSRKGITPILSPNEDCFIQCVKHHFQNVLKESIADINFSRVQKRTNFQDIALFEADNTTIGVNVLSFDYHMNTEELSHFEPKYTSRNKEAKYEIILLYHNNHFTYVNDVSKLLRKTRKNGKTRKQFLCFTCLTLFTKKHNFENHKRICNSKNMAIGHFPHTHMKFRSWYALLPPPFVIYADIETYTEEFEEVSSGESTKKLNELKPLMIGYYIKFSQEEKVFDNHPSLREFETMQIFEGEDCIQKFFIKLKNDCYRIKTIVRIAEDLAWNSDLEKKFRSETFCGICRKPYAPNDDYDMNLRRVRHHDHLTGEFISSAHTLCNLRLVNE